MSPRSSSRGSALYVPFGTAFFLATVPSDDDKKAVDKGVALCFNLYDKDISRAAPIEARAFLAKQWAQHFAQRGSQKPWSEMKDQFTKFVTTWQPSSEAAAST